MHGRSHWRGPSPGGRARMRGSVDEHAVDGADHAGSLPLGRAGGVVEAPDVLFREARRRRRRRWLGAGLAAACTIGLVAGLLLSIGAPPPQPPAAHPTASPTSRPRHQASATQSVSPPLVSGTTRLVSVAFFNATSGYGVFSIGQTPNCQIAVASTSDGGADFRSPVTVASCSAVGSSASLAFDDHGDGFLYSATDTVLYESHDGGSSWTASPQAGDVLSVEALGYSVWMLTVQCPVTSPPPDLDATCQLSVRESTDGGGRGGQAPASRRRAPPTTLPQPVAGDWSASVGTRRTWRAAPAMTGPASRRPCPSGTPTTGAAPGRCAVYRAGSGPREECRSLQPLQARCTQPAVGSRGWATRTSPSSFPRTAA